jgi:hypothetical protein
VRQRITAKEQLTRIAALGVANAPARELVQGARAERGVGDELDFALGVERFRGSLLDLDVAQEDPRRVDSRGDRRILRFDRARVAWGASTRYAAGDLAGTMGRRGFG